jgi:hypothetical protein
LVLADCVLAGVWRVDLEKRKKKKLIESNTSYSHPAKIAEKYGDRLNLHASDGTFQHGAPHTV